MIFYLALDDVGFRQLRPTQAEAKAISKNFQQIDIPTDKAGLQAAVQELLTEADQLRQPGLPMEAPVVAERAPEPVSSVARCDARCSGCHRQLTTTVNGAITLAIGDDMTALGDWIQDAPDWVIPRIHEALREREKANASRQAEDEMS
jgi:hypothetical protein